MVFLHLNRHKGKQVREIFPGGGSKEMNTIVNWTPSKKKLKRVDIPDSLALNLG